jgi:hypothetical protein
MYFDARSRTHDPRMRVRVNVIGAIRPVECCSFCFEVVPENFESSAIFSPRPARGAIRRLLYFILLRVFLESIRAAQI